MKTRTGFVSNSSSSSFLIYGASFDSLEVDGESYSSYELSEKLQEIVKGTCLEVEPGQEHYTVYVGRSWSSVKDDETGRQFKDSVEKAVKEKFGDKPCGTHEEAWYNG